MEVTALTRFKVIKLSDTKTEIELYFKTLLALNPIGIYQLGISDLFDVWHRCIDVEVSYLSHQHISTVDF